MRITTRNSLVGRYQRFVNTLSTNELINIYKILDLPVSTQRGGYLSRETLVKNLLQKHPTPPILPIPHQHLPKESPFPKITCGDVLRCVLKRPSTQKDRRVWSPIVERVTRQINHLCKGGTLPSGTLLYHGSLNPSLDFFSGNKPHPFFFGIEESISLWYIYEAWLGQTRDRDISQSFGYLYTLRVTHPIPVTKVIDQVINHPSEVDECWGNRNGVCIHPQQIFHGDTDTIRDLGVEVTLRPDYFRESLQVLDKPVEISIQKLQELQQLYETD